MRYIALIVSFLALSACAREIPPMKQAFMDACLQGNEGACDVLAAAAAGDASRYNAAMSNWNTATGNAANWAVQQQNTGTYSGGGTRSCSTNPLNGHTTCY